MKLIEHPYRHYIEESFFNSGALGLLTDFSLKNTWLLSDDAGFVQYFSQKEEVEDLVLENTAGRAHLSFLLEQTFIDKLVKMFCVPISGCVGISFHKLSKGCHNIVHNDHNANGERVRIVCYLSDPYQYDGGELNLFSSNSDNVPAVSYKFNRNSAFFFEMTEESVHSVSEVFSGERICLVITYK